VQIKELESRSLLPTLEALDAEFGADEVRAAAHRNRGASMNTRLMPSQDEFPTHLRAGPPTPDAMEPSYDNPDVVRPSLGRRVLRRLVRLSVVLGVGVCSTLAWQSYGDDARAMIAKSSPQLGWVAPQPASLAPTTAEAAAPPASAVSPELQQLAFGLAALRKSVDLLTTQFAAGQQQMGDEITKLQADEQEILRKLSATAPKPTASQAHKPTPVAAAAPPPASAQAR
jgi:hypothetical protein